MFENGAADINTSFLALFVELSRWKDRRFGRSFIGAYTARLNNGLAVEISFHTEFLQGGEAMLYEAISAALHEEKWPHQVTWINDRYDALVIRGSESYVSRGNQTPWEALGNAAIAAWKRQPTHTINSLSHDQCPECIGVYAEDINMTSCWLCGKTLPSRGANKG